MTTEDVEAFKPKKLSDVAAGSQSIALDKSGDLVLFGGSDGTAGVFSVSEKKVTARLEGAGGAVTDVQWIGSRIAIASSSGAVQVFDDGAEVSSFTRHAGAVTAVAVHPSGEILASVGVDKSFVFYDLEKSVVASQTFTNTSESLSSTRIYAAF